MWFYVTAIDYELVVDGKTNQKKLRPCQRNAGHQRTLLAFFGIS